ncbi:Mobile element protein [Acetobacter tropicalis]|uniref:Mobile element protein n=1 Tax=Acetobacter tropicalis TaxID=104102 RepID=A0A094YHJ3_9PROT|nr:Mobile element protein [Acetobacter tropicalis]
MQQHREITGGHPLPADLPRERVVLPAPTQCPCCGETRLSKLGESITETLEVIPRQFKVIQAVREKFTCRDCESITQPPVPFYPISRRRAGPKLLAGILCDKYLQHLLLIRVHVLAAGRLHADDTTVPVLAKGRTVTGRLWNYVRDNHSFGGTAPPAVWFRYSRDRKGEHPVDHLSGWTGIVQSDAYAGYNALAKPGRQPAPVVSAGCCSKLQKRTKPPLP